MWQEQLGTKSHTRSARRIEHSHIAACIPSHVNTIPDPASAFIKNYEVYEGAADAPSSVKAGRRCSR
jgi:hypothetical protein